MNLIYDIAARLGIGMPFDDCDTLSKVESHLPSFARFLVGPGKMCTSVIWKDPTDGLIGFGSNLDLPRGSDLAKFMYHSNFYEAGKLVYKAQHVFGVKGSQRAFSVKGGWYIALNERDHKVKDDSTLSWLWDITIKKSLSPMLWIVDAIRKYEHLEDAMKAAATDDLSSPCYFIMGGVMKDRTTDGCVIERNFNGLNAKYCLSDSPDQWFLVQTNWDRSIPDPKDDYRRVPMENKISGMGKDAMTTDHLRMFLSEHPNFRVVLESDDDVTMTTTLGQFGYDDNEGSFFGFWWNYDQE